MDRPRSLTVLAWFMLFSGVFSLLGVFYLFVPGMRDVWEAAGTDPQLVGLNAVVGGVVQIVAGRAILRADAWGRLLYLIYYPVALLISGLTYPDLFGAMLLPAVVFFGLVAFLLYRPAANAYFAGAYREDHDRRAALAAHRKAGRTSSDLLRVLGVFVLAFAVLMLFMTMMVAGIASFDEGGGSPGAVILFTGAPALLSLAVGALLWGPRRWAESVGWTLATAGVLGALYAAMLWYLTASGMWDEMVGRMGDEALPEGVLDGILAGTAAGVVVGIAGGALVWWQHRRDLQAVDRAGPDPSAEA